MQAVFCLGPPCRVELPYRWPRAGAHRGKYLTKLELLEQLPYMLRGSITGEVPMRTDRAFEAATSFEVDHAGGQPARGDDGGGVATLALPGCQHGPVLLPTSTAGTARSPITVMSGHAELLRAGS